MLLVASGTPSSQPLFSFYRPATTDSLKLESASAFVSREVQCRMIIMCVSKEWPTCPISPPSSAHDGLGSPNSLQQAALTVVASVLCAATHVDISQISFLPEAPISMGLFHAAVSCLSSHFSGHLPFVPYLALSVNVPRRSFLLCSSSSTILPSVTTSIHVF